jgi:hypothetical protein
MTALRPDLKQREIPMEPPIGETVIIVESNATRRGPSPIGTRAAPLTLLLILSLSGCEGIVRQNYKGTPAAPAVALSPYSGTTLVLGSIDPDSDGAHLVQDGYVQIGVSAFKTDRHVTIAQLQGEAGIVGADVVLFSMRKPETHLAVRPLAQNNDGTLSGLPPITHLNGSLMPSIDGGIWGTTRSVGGGIMDFKGSVSGSGIPGINSEDMAFITAPQFECTVTFWRKKST